jgi:small-conductance mechanosensitive channel
VAEIKACLLDAVQLHPRVVISPAPFVLFTDFADKSLKFEVHFCIAMQHMTDGRRIESDLREAIDATLREAGLMQDAVPSAVGVSRVSRPDTPQVAALIPRRRAS